MTPESSNALGLERKRKSAGIAKSIELGLIIKVEHPEVADLFLSLIPKRQIIVDLALCDEYRVTPAIMESSLTRAIRGYKGGYESFTSTPPYEGLIPDARLVDATVSRIRSKLAKESVSKGIGIHGLSKEERVKQTGHTPWTQEELAYVRHLLYIPECLHMKGPHKFLPNYNILAKKINENVHNGDSVRTPKAVKHALERYLPRNTILK